MNKHLTKIFFASLLIFFASCHNLFNDDDDRPQHDYLVSYEIERSYLPIMVETLFDQILGNYPEMQEIRERVKHGLVVYKITYKTTFEGEPIIASGLVSAPTGEGPFPMISYQNGTNTLHGDAPSVNPDRSFYMLLEVVASTGFVVSLPDYLGFGETSNMYHPYLNADATVPVVIDMLRAVEELGELRGFSINKDLYLTGYSMGGWATMQVQKELEANHSNEFNLKASAPSAGPYDLNYMNSHILGQETYPQPYFMGFVYNSYKNAGLLDVPLDEIFASPYDERIPDLYDGSLSGGQINDQLTTDMSELFTENFLVNYASDTAFTQILDVLEANSVVPFDVSTPTHLIHSTGDELVPFEVSQNMYQQLLEESGPSENIKLIPLPDHTHTDGIIPAGLYAIDWFFQIQEQ